MQPRLRLLLLSLIIGLLAVFTGCTTTRGSEPMDRSRVGVAREVRTGTVTDVRIVTIEGSQSGVGAVAGGAAGAAVASKNIGSGSGKILSGIAGGVLGAVAGNQTEKAITQEEGQAITVRLDNGRTVEIVQPLREAYIVEGERVTVSGGRVRPAPGSPDPQAGTDSTFPRSGVIERN
ncbi:MAG: glycine zipper 2TM domain-containing protein [Opitutales bacterium]